MFSPKECDINKGTLENIKTEFQNLHDRICGRAEGYGDVATTTGDTFSNLIASPLKSTARENTESWSSSMMACTVAIGSLSETIEAVEWYEEKIDNIRTRFNSAVSGAPNAEDITAVAALAAPFNTEANTAWNTLEQKCQDAGDTLANGADPDNIRKLIEAGHISADIAFATTGDWDHFYFDPDDAVTAANAIKESTANGYDGGLELQLAIVNALVQRGIYAQKNGQKLSKNELDFIDAFFSEFEVEEGQAAQRRGESTPQDFLNFVDSVSDSEHLDEETKAAINEQMAGAILIASDESLGGGIDCLPQDVSDAAAGVATTYDNLERLNDLLSYSDEEVQGGVDFSATMAATVARVIENGGVNELDLSEEVAEGLLDVATRNDEANYVILSGEYPDGTEFEHHPNNSDMTPEDIMASLYTHDWSDDGKTVARVTEWIIPSSGRGSEEELIEQGLDALVALFEDESFRESMSATGESVQESTLDDSGIVATEVKGDLWLNASAGHLNPELAGVFGDIFIAHMDEFSNSDGVSSSDKRDARFTPESMLAFTQVSMGDEETAQEVYANVLVNSAEVMEDYLRNVEDWKHEDSSAAGSLQGLVERALLNESSNRVESHNKQADFYNKISSGVVGVLGGLDLGVSGQTMEIAKIIANESLEFEKVDEDEEKKKKKLLLEETYERDEKIKGTAVSVYSEVGENRDALIEKIEEEYEDAVYEKDGEKHVKWDHKDWEAGRNSDGSLITVFSEIAGGIARETVDGVETWGDAVTTYGDVFDGARVRWNEVG